jgi:hypothetical protein
MANASISVPQTLEEAPASFGMTNKEVIAKLEAEGYLFYVRRCDPKNFDFEVLASGIKRFEDAMIIARHLHVEDVKVALKDKGFDGSKMGGMGSKTAYSIDPDICMTISATNGRVLIDNIVDITSQCEEDDTWVEGLDSNLEDSLATADYDYSAVLQAARDQAAEEAAEEAEEAAYKLQQQQQQQAVSSATESSGVGDKRKRAKGE